MTIPDVQVGVYADLWSKGRYRVELNAKLDYDPSDIDAALEKLGYESIDADQWGQSYRHKDNPQKTAELDEVEYDDRYVKLVLRRGDLNEAATEGAKNELELEYTKIYQIPQNHYNEADYLSLYDYLPDVEFPLTP